MQRALVACAAVVLLPLVAPLAEAQNTCVTTTWTDTGPVRNVVRPEVDLYQGRISFTRAPGCPTGCPDATSSQAVFRILNQQQPWLEANFTQNPVPINGSAQPLASRTTENDVFFRLNRSAPFESNFLLQVAAECGGANTFIRSTASKSFRVGPLIDVTADVVSAGTIADGAQWVVRITNHGNVPLVAEFEPHPSEREAEIRWTTPEFQTIPVAEGDSASIAVAVTISVQGERIPGNLSVTLRMREADDAQAPPFTFDLALPYTVFTGKSTPTVPIAWIVVAFSGLVAARRPR